jgi:tetratricopeptide (TPR) repeat protein
MASVAPRARASTASRARARVASSASASSTARRRASRSKHGDARGVDVNRRAVARAVAVALATRAAPRARATATTTTDEFNALERRAKRAYYARDLKRAREDLTAIIAMEPETPEWRERRAQVLVDMKLFEEAIADYDEAERMYRAMYDDATTTYKSLGMLSNRALAYEGLSRWDAAIADYSEALKYSSMMGATPPYVLNSRGNCYNSIGEYEKALDDYSRAAGIFQQSRNLSGAIYAQSNAALMLAELGRIDEAIEDMEKVKRRAAGSVDMRAALAALYWSRGEEQRAEDNWNWSCTAINSGQMVEGGPVLDGCELYRDYDWLGRIRRWPPSMVQKFKRFIELS